MDRSLPAPSYVSTALVARALEEIRLQADDLARGVAITRAQLDAYTLAPATMPFPVRAQVGTYLATVATSDAQRELAATLICQAAMDSATDGVRFVGDVLNALPFEEREAAWNAYLASPLVRHPAVEPITLAEIAANGGMSVAELLTAAAGPGA